eukprot:COSAG06_NODE_27923_length_584_cov_0.686598_1_plen_22_part_10
MSIIAPGLISTRVPVANALVQL